MLKRNNPIVSIYSATDKPVPIKNTGMHIHSAVLGTGFFIGPSILLTCSHVVGNRKKVLTKIEFPYKVEYAEAQVLYHCRQLDFALLKVDEEYNRLEMSTFVPLESTCHIICPHEKKSPYELTLVYNSLMGDKLDSLSYVLEGPYMPPGTSGSPMLYKGKAVGLHYAGGEARWCKDKALCVPMHLIIEKIQVEWDDEFAI